MCHNLLIRAFLQLGLVNQFVQFVGNFEESEVQQCCGSLLRMQRLSVFEIQGVNKLVVICWVEAQVLGIVIAVASDLGFH